MNDTGEYSPHIYMMEIDTSETSNAMSTAENEYETQFFNFAPNAFCDGLYSAVVDYTWEYFFLSQAFMKEEFSDTIKQEELQRASEVFLGAMSKAVDKAFDKFETYMLTSIMCVPDSVVLPEDKAHEEYRDFSEEDEAKLDQDIQRLKDRIRAAKYLNKSLRNEEQQINQIQKEYTQFLEILQSMEKTMKDAGVTDIRESLVFIIEKSNQVINLLQRIETTDPSKRPLPDTQDLLELGKKIKLDHFVIDH